MSTITTAEIIVTSKNGHGGVKTFDAIITEASNPSFAGTEKVRKIKDLSVGFFRVGESISNAEAVAINAAILSIDGDSADGKGYTFCFSEKSATR